ncbi:monovalent cation:proton antiporter-2 (CPA2) family protein [Thalassospiraceae bacterium LMO-JJ14]|nr:monovalent cation:proton antiporter-2 (CPA2) family protein [Thalassospiraceae bacterium LMO-JJ14]
MSLITETAIFLGAAVVAVPFAKRLGLGSVLGYLIAGAAIGPWGLRLVSDVESILHFGEFGVVLLLFLIGLELQPSRLWTMRRPVFGLGGAQVVVSAAILAGVVFTLGVPWQGALAIGLAASLSSTAFALQIMAEKGHLTSRYGRAAFSVLLFQDIAAIPLIALVPLLGGGAEMRAADVWIDGLTIAGVIAAVIVVGRYLLKFVLSNIAETGLREIFTACGLLTVLGTALLMQSVGLSMALGAFLAGVLLADSEYRHALEADIEPFKGLLLGLFFIAVGMSVNFGLLVTEFLVVIGLVVGLVGTKAAVLWGLGYANGLNAEARRNLAIAISQGGEFAFVILGLAVGAGALARGHADLAILVVTLSMAVTPLLYLLSGRLLKVPQADVPAEEMPMELEHPVIIAGFGRFGQIIGRILRAKHIGFTALELDPNQINFVANYGNKIYYGDSTRYDVMYAAGAHKAKVLLLAVDDADQSVKTAELVRRRFPNLTVIARAKDRQHAYRLMEQGVDHVIRETFHSGIEAGRLTLQSIGFASKDARHIAEMFRDHDERRLKNQFGNHTDEKAFAEAARVWANELEEIFAEDALNDEPEGDEKG